MKALVVYSGGMDSTVLLHLAIREYEEVEAISFDYGSKHNDREFREVEWNCQRLGVKYTRIKLPFEHFESNLLKGGGEIPEGHYADDTMKKTVVPFRNGIMLAFAAGFAESRDSTHLLLGNHFGDHAVYPDCRKSFIVPMCDAIQAGTYKQIKVESPFCDMSKTEICALGLEFSVDHNHSYSCYNGGEHHCGRCSTCFERKEAFYECQMVDPTVYIDESSYLKLKTEYSDV